MALIQCKECNNTYSSLASICPKCGAPTSFSTGETQSEKPREYKKVSNGLALLIVLFPVLFVWFLLDKAYSPKDRIIGFVYLAASILFFSWVRGENKTTVVIDHPTSTYSTQPYIQPNLEQTHTPEPPTEATSTPIIDNQPQTDNRLPISSTGYEYYAAYQRNEVAADNKYKGRKLKIRVIVWDISKDYSGEVYLRVLGEPDTTGLSTIHASLANYELAKAAELGRGDVLTMLCIGGTMMLDIPTLKDCNIIDVVTYAQKMAIFQKQADADLAVAQSRFDKKAAELTNPDIPQIKRPNPAENEPLANDGHAIQDPF